MNDLPDFDLRVAQNCPRWCAGEDHLKDAEGEPPEHFGYAASLGFLAVTITQPLKGIQGVVIALSNGPGQHVEDLTSVEARAVAAWLLRAADLVDFKDEANR